jgi:hypothetical protein
MKTINWKKILGITVASVGTAFIVASVFAKKKKNDSIVAFGKLTKQGESIPIGRLALCLPNHNIQIKYAL